MKKILIVSHAMEIGGAERALLGLLNSFNDQVQVDLFLCRQEGELLHLVPKNINLLPTNQASYLAVPMVKTLKDKQIAYSLDGEKIILEDCSYFYFKFNDGEIKIIPTHAMKACNSIKHNSSTNIKTKNKTINGEKVTVLYLEADDGRTYAYDKYNGYCIIQSGKATILSRIGFCSIAFFMAALIVYQSMEYKKLIKTTKKKSNSTIQYIIGGEK